MKKTVQIISRGYKNAIQEALNLFVVSNGSEISEIQDVIKKIGVLPENTYLMPEGLTEEQLAKKRPWLIELCITLGYNYTDRLHIAAYGNKRLS